MKKLVIELTDKEAARLVHILTNSLGVQEKMEADAIAYAEESDSNYFKNEAYDYGRKAELLRKVLKVLNTEDKVEEE